MHISADFFIGCEKFLFQLKALQKRMQKDKGRFFLAQALREKRNVEKLGGCVFLLLTVNASWNHETWHKALVVINNFYRDLVDRMFVHEIWRLDFANVKKPFVWSVSCEMMHRSYGISFVLVVFSPKIYFKIWKYWVILARLQKSIDYH